MKKYKKKVHSESKLYVESRSLHIIYLSLNEMNFLTGNEKTLKHQIIQ